MDRWTKRLSWTSLHRGVMGRTALTRAAFCPTSRVTCLHTPRHLHHHVLEAAAFIHSFLFLSRSPTSRLLKKIGRRRTCAFTAAVEASG